MENIICPHCGKEIDPLVIFKETGSHGGQKTAKTLGKEFFRKIQKLSVLAKKKKKGQK